MAEPREGVPRECQSSAGVSVLLASRPELAGVGLSDLLSERWSQ